MKSRAANIAGGRPPPVVVHPPQSVWAPASELRGWIRAPGGALELNCRILEHGVSRRSVAMEFIHPPPPFARLFVFAAGEARVWLDGRLRRLTPGHLWLLPAEQAFRVRYGPSVMHYFHLHVHDAAGQALFRGGPALRGERAPALAEALFVAQDAGQELALATLLFHLMARFAEADREALLARQERGRRFAEVLGRIAAGPPAALSVKELAGLAHLSRAALSKGFQRQLGVSLKEYLIQAALRRAREQLAFTDKSAQEIAAELGYAQPGYFHRVFRARLGLTPLAYRAAARAGRG